MPDDETDEAEVPMTDDPRTRPLRGRPLLHEPRWNRGTAFTDAERNARVAELIWYPTYGSATA